MKNDITSNSSENIVQLSVIRRERHRALSPYGPVKAGLTTWPDQEINKEDQEARLTELLNSLENIVESLQYKSFTVYDTLTIAIEGARVALLPSTESTIGTDL
jgi:hypothetical protein